MSYPDFEHAVCGSCQIRTMRDEKSN